MAKKTREELILDILRSGQSMAPAQIAFMISQIIGTNVKAETISNELLKMTRKGKGGIGYFIQQQQIGNNSYIYQIVPEALEMTQEETYALIRRSGNDQFTLKDAVYKYPQLVKYLPESHPIYKKTLKTWRVHTSDQSERTIPKKKAIGAIIDLLKKSQIKINITIRFGEEQHSDHLKRE